MFTDLRACLMIKGMMFLILMSTTPVFSFDYGASVDPSIMMMNAPGSVPNSQDEEAVMVAFQSMFIKSVFLDKVFTNQSRFYGEDSGSSIAGADIYNQIMIQKFSKDLAEKDAFKLKDILQRGLDDRKKRH